MSSAPVDDLFEACKNRFLWDVTYAIEQAVLEKKLKLQKEPKEPVWKQDGKADLTLTRSDIFSVQIWYEGKLKATVKRNPPGYLSYDPWVYVHYARGIETMSSKNSVRFDQMLKQFLSKIVFG